jgi:LPS-assembly lipoprotein
MHRIPTVLALALLMSACGFQPRRALELPDSLMPVRVQSGDAYSPLAASLERSFERVGAVTERPDAARSTLRIHAEQWSEGPVSTDASARIQEYVTRLAVEFDMADAGGATRVPRQRIELSREYSFDAARSFGTPSEQAVIRDELRRDMAAAILRRVDIALRQD